MVREYNGLGFFWTKWILFCLLLLSIAMGGKQKIIVVLREPLRAENTKLKILELSNNKGVVRDLQIDLNLGVTEKKLEKKGEVQQAKLELKVRPLRRGFSVSLFLPKSAHMELVVMDFYGKSVGLLAEGLYEKGRHRLTFQDLKDVDHNGVKFLALKIEGKIALKQVLAKVH